MKDSTLVDIFLTQAESALGVMSDEACTDKSRTRELADLMGAAELTGNQELELRVTALARMLRDGGGAGIIELAALIKELQPLSAAEAGTKAAAEVPAEARRPRAGSIGDSSPTLVRRSPSKPSSRFDTGEHLTLLNFFREEAREGLDRITNLLLSATAEKPGDPVLHELMRLTHGLKGAAGTVDLPTVAELTHEFESAVEAIRRDTLRWSLPLRDELVEVSDRLREVIADATDMEAQPDGVESLRALLQNLGTATASRQGVEIEITDTAPLLVTEVNTDTFAERRRPDRRMADIPMLRVDPTRIDRLMNSVGELVFDRTRIERRVSELSTELKGLRSALDTLSALRSGWVHRGTPIRADELSTALSELESQLVDTLPMVDDAMERLDNDTGLLRRTEFALQDGLTGVRMQSVRSLFQRLTPQLRAIARQSGKQVRLVTAGGETEFDKTVADQMIDPLIQLLRNSVAHGIETTEQRAAVGKNIEGRINVTARHEGNVVVLEVSDDGNGIDVHELRSRLVKNGRWTESQSAQASDERVTMMIFDAGVSSRAQADNLSGRGVGLSAVRETVTRLGGEVLVSSIPKRGTTFTMRLPLTTAIANALLFKIGGHVYAIPNVHVLDQGAIPLPLAATTADEEGQPLPLVPLHEVLGFAIPEGVESCSVVLLEYLGKRLAISCDRIVGPREIVVKNLGPMLASVALYAGGTISPSGKVQLILDPAALVNIAYPEARASSTRSSQHVGDRVLVVDDSKAIRETMRRMLERAGYQVLTASDGHDAWLTLLEHRCDLLVTDLEMPGEGGFELLERLRSDTRYATLPALVISSKASHENRERAQELGVLEFLGKPVRQEQLVDALRSVRRGSRQD